MMTHLKWFDREFRLDVPPGQFPNILERLRGTPHRLVERTLGLDRVLLTRRECAQWSLQEQAGHLLDLEPLWFRRATQILSGEPELEVADLTNRKTFEAQHNARAVADICADFTSARTAFVALLEDADESSVVRSALHPRLRQPMRLIDLAMFVAEHDDHHLASITALRRR
jgi:uncharacterized damage-inducible protein DinB